MNNQINSSNSGDSVGYAVRLFGTWLRPNFPPAPQRDVQNPINTIRLFGTVIYLNHPMRRESSQQYMRLFGANIPIHNSPLRANPRSIRLFGQTIRVDNPSTTSVIGTNVISYQTNPTQALPQEIIVIDSSSDEEEEQADAQRNNADVDMEDAQGLNNANEEEFPGPDNEDMLVDAVFRAPEGIEINFNNINDEIMALDIIIRMLNGGLNPLEIQQALRIDSYKEMVGDRKECTVCLEYFHDGEVIANLRCNHPFHPLCITDWLEKKNRCPNCRVVALDIDD